MQIVWVPAARIYNLLNQVYIAYLRDPGFLNEQPSEAKTAIYHKLQECCEIQWIDSVHLRVVFITMVTADLCFLRVPCGVEFDTDMELAAAHPSRE